MLIFHFEALGSEGVNRDDFRGENGTSAGFIQIALALLEKAGIDGLRFGLLINLFGAAAFQDDAGNASDIVPDGEIGDDGASGQSEDVSSFKRSVLVIRKNLARGDAGVAVIDADVDGHLFQREPSGVRLLFIAGEEEAGIGERHAGEKEKGEKSSHWLASSFSRMRTRPLSAPI